MRAGSEKPFGFAKDRHVRAGSEFRRIQSRGRRVPTEHFVFVVAPGPAGPARLGITASRKVGNAVRRNRLKRLVREAFRTNPGFLPDGVDLVVICRKDDEALSLSLVSAEWERARNKLEKAALHSLTARRAGT